MKKSILAISIIASSLLLLAGCGSPKNDKKTTTGIGYYLDSAVSGINYTCGSKTGTTDADGAFTFEKGKDCTFTVAGVTLKSVPADNLVDKVKVVEDSNVTAAFLQSLDNDGNPANGIQITPKVIEILTKALQDAKITTVPKDQELDTVVSKIDHEDSDYEGHKVTEDEAQQHLDKTQTSVIEDLIVGKTYYVAVNDVDPVHVETLEFKDDGQTLIDTYPKNGQETTGTFTYSIANERLHIVGTGGDGDKIDTDMMKGPITQTDTYIEDANGNQLYKTKQAAEDALDGSGTSDGGSTGASAPDLKSLLSGKTFYIPQINDNKVAEIVKFVYNQDATQATGYIYINGTLQKQFTTSITIDGNKITSDEKGYSLYQDKTDDYLVIEDHAQDGTVSQSRDYFDEAKAEEYLNTLQNDNGANSSALEFTEEMVNKKTLVTYKPKDNGKPSSCVTFNQDKTVVFVAKKNGQLQKNTSADADWKVQDGNLTFHTVNGNYQIWDLQSQNSDNYDYMNYWYNGDDSLIDSDKREFTIETSCPTNQLVDD